MFLLFSKWSKIITTGALYLRESKSMRVREDDPERRYQTEGRLTSTGVTIPMYFKAPW